uniref:ATP-binding protein n=1 Tax=Nitratifractor sp. TaxID=2268144 RepID=UPI0025DCF0FF
LLKIRDNGRGMCEPDRAFDRYYREGERGLGLGLHIVKKLAGDMRIGLKLESREGEGTTVSLDLREVMQR